MGVAFVCLVVSCGEVWGQSSLSYLPKSPNYPSWNKKGTWIPEDLKGRSLLDSLGLKCRACKRGKKSGNHSVAWGLGSAGCHP